MNGQDSFIMYFWTKLFVLKEKVVVERNRASYDLQCCFFVNDVGTEKLQSLVFGKYRNPRSFKNIKRLHYQ